MRLLKCGLLQIPMKHQTAHFHNRFVLLSQRFSLNPTVMVMDFPVSSMSTAEKIAAMEQLWASLQLQADHRSPDWHAKVLEERKRKMDAGQLSFSTLDEVRSRIQRGRS